MILTIPGHVPSPNEMNAKRLRERMHAIKSMREGAFYASLSAIREGRAVPVLGPADVNFHAVRTRLLDPSINLPSSFKWVQDGLHTCCHRPRHFKPACPDLVLPLGDGPKSPYRFTFTQERGAPESTRITIAPHTPAPAAGEDESRALVDGAQSRNQESRPGGARG